LQSPYPSDYVIGTGQSYSVSEFADMVFKELGLSRDYIKVSENNIRPLDIPELRADSSKAKKVLDWESKVNLKDLIGLMIESDLRLFSNK